MNEKEMRELDRWISDNVPDCPKFLFKPTTQPADAMSVLKKCAERCGVRICHYKDRTPNVWDIYATDGRFVGSDAPTLELSICKYAKELFSKHAKETQA